MTETSLATYRRRLLSLARRLQGEASGLADEALRNSGGDNLSSTPLHPADLGTDYSQQEVSILMLENDQQILTEVTAALARLDGPDFGICEECSQGIAPARLDAVPYARYCIQCAQDLEAASPAAWARG